MSRIFGIVLVGLVLQCGCQADFVRKGSLRENLSPKVEDVASVKHSSPTSTTEIRDNCGPVKNQPVQVTTMLSGGWLATGILSLVLGLVLRWLVGMTRAIEKNDLKNAKQAIATRLGSTGLFGPAVKVMTVGMSKKKVI